MVMKRSVVLVYIIIGILSLSLVSAGFSEWFAGITGKVTSNGVAFNVTIGNTAAPLIKAVTVGASESIVEDSQTITSINFTAYDGDGFGDLRASTAMMNISISNGSSPLRQNLTCSQINTFSTNYSNFTCTLQLWYFDMPGTWNITAAINDTTGNFTQNTTQVFTLGETSAFVLSPNATTFSSLSAGSANQSSNNDPILLNNTGNRNVTIGNIQVNATDLIGETDNSKGIYARNMTVGVITGSNGECDAYNNSYNATIMFGRANFTGVNQSILARGNHTINNGVAGQEQLYICIQKVGSELSAQSYSTVTQGSWTIKILVTLFFIRTARKKTRKAYKASFVNQYKEMKA